MSFSFEAVSKEDFMTFTPGKKPTYAQIEEALIGIGGGGLGGNAYKKEALEHAGWSYGKLISYGAHPDKAANAFNRLRDVLSETDDRESVLSKLN